jgi:uncharacterized damage-inducible protein DinB
MNDTLCNLFRYKAWANRELFEAIVELGAEAPITSLAIKALSHTFVVDRIFFAHLGRKIHSFASPNLSEMQRLESLAADMRSSDAEYVDYVSTLDRQQLTEPIDFTFTDGAHGRMTREEMLMHVITHGVGHRGQVSAVMLLNSLAPVKDGFTTYLHRAVAAPSARRREVV